MRQLLKTKLVDLDLSVRALNCLKAAEVETLGDLVKFNKNDLLKFRNFGKKSLTELDELLVDLTSGDETLAEAAMLKLVELGEAAFPALKALLDAPDADHRWWALSVLAQIETANVDWMLAALDDDSTEVRQCAALGLSVHPDDKSVSALINAMHDPDSMVSTLAANALVKIGEVAVPALLIVLEEDESGQDALQVKAARHISRGVCTPNGDPSNDEAIQS